MTTFLSRAALAALLVSFGLGMSACESEDEVGYGVETEQTEPTQPTEDLSGEAEVLEDETLSTDAEELDETRRPASVETEGVLEEEGLIEEEAEETEY